MCRVCNDHGRKGKRAGFNFDGVKVGYNCFNCGHTAIYDPSIHQSVPDDMRTVLDAFDVPREDWQRMVLENLRDGPRKSTERVSPLADIEPTEIALPSYFYQLIDDPNDEWAVCANQHLVEQRQMTCKDHQFYLVRKSKDKDESKWYGRLIIPVYKQGKLIFYQGRDLAAIRPDKYRSPPISRENVLFGYDYIFEDTNNPLYIVEGFFDAYAVKGVAVFGSKITQGQIRWINQTRRPKVVIPDRFGDGHRLAQQALELGWSVSTPDIGSCKDMSEAVVKYGLLYVLRSVKDNTRDGFEAASRIKLYCNDTR